MRALQSWPDEERQVLWRAAGVSFIALVCLTIALEVLPYYLGGLWGRAPLVPTMLMLLPQVLAIPLPMALTFGVAIGLVGHKVSARLAIAVAAIAFVCSIGAVANLGWLMPDANQAFRTAAFERMRQQQGVGWGSPPARGENELTFADLDRLIQRRRAFPVGSYELDDLNRLRTAYHMRWALAFATFPLALFAMSLAACARKRWKIGIAIGVALLGYYVLLYFGRLFALSHGLPPPGGAWLANVVFILISAAAVMRVRRDVEAEPSAISS